MQIRYPALGAIAVLAYAVVASGCGSKLKPVRNVLAVPVPVNSLTFALDNALGNLEVTVPKEWACRATEENQIPTISLTDPSGGTQIRFTSLRSTRDVLGDSYTDGNWMEVERREEMANRSTYGQAPLGRPTELILGQGARVFFNTVTIKGFPNARRQTGSMVFGETYVIFTSDYLIRDAADKLNESLRFANILGGVRAESSHGVWASEKARPSGTFELFGARISCPAGWEGFMLSSTKVDPCLFLYSTKPLGANRLWVFPEIARDSHSHRLSVHSMARDVFQERQKYMKVEHATSSVQQLQIGDKHVAFYSARTPTHPHLVRQRGMIADPNGSCHFMSDSLGPVSTATDAAILHYQSVLSSVTFH